MPGARFPSRPIRQPLSLDGLLKRWRMLVRSIAVPYKPERHYMRGPGPRSHTMHQGSARGGTHR